MHEHAHAVDAGAGGGGGASDRARRYVDGVPKVVQIAWLRGKGHGVAYLVRIVFDGCDDATVSDVLTRLVVAW